MVTGRKQREVYVGNLTIGVVTDIMLKELFSGALAHLVPDPVGNPPVVNAQLDPSGTSKALGRGSPILSFSVVCPDAGPVTVKAQTILLKLFT